MKRAFKLLRRIRDLKRAVLYWRREFDRKKSELESLRREYVLYVAWIERAFIKVGTGYQNAQR